MDEIYSSYAVGKTMLKIALRVASLKTCILVRSRPYLGIWKSSLKMTLLKQM